MFLRFIKFGGELGSIFNVHLNKIRCCFRGISEKNTKWTSKFYFNSCLQDLKYWLKRYDYFLIVKNFVLKHFQLHVFLCVSKFYFGAIHHWNLELTFQFNRPRAASGDQLTLHNIEMQISWVTVCAF